MESAKHTPERQERVPSLSRDPPFESVSVSTSMNLDPTKGLKLFSLGTLSVVDESVPTFPSYQEVVLLVKFCRGRRDPVRPMARTEPRR